ANKCLCRSNQQAQETYRFNIFWTLDYSDRPRHRIVDHCQKSVVWIDGLNEKCCIFILVLHAFLEAHFKAHTLYHGNFEEEALFIGHLEDDALFIAILEDGSSFIAILEDGSSFIAILEEEASFIAILEEEASFVSN